LSAGSDSEGDSLSQTFITTVNQVYTVDFDAAVYGIPDSGANLRIQVQAVGNTTVLDQLVSPPVSGTFNANGVSFTHYHFIFTADSTVTTLRLVNVGMGNRNADEVIDSVSVA